MTSWGFPGYTECGSMSTFDALASDAACSVPPFSGYRFPIACGRIDYAGTIRLYCAPDRMTVVAYFWGVAREGLSSFVSFLHYGHQYESGSGGGSGTVSIGQTAMDGMSVPFYGLQQARVRATPTGFEPQPLRVWFLAQSLFDPGTVETTGGFDITLMP